MKRSKYLFLTFCLLVLAVSLSSPMEVLASDDIDNGGFETGSLSPWRTHFLRKATVTSMSYYVHSGSYGCRLAYYVLVGMTYYPTYIYQSVNIDVDDLASAGITFWMRSTNDAVRVSIYYSTHGFSVYFDPSEDWVQRSIPKSMLSAGETIIRIRFDRHATSIWTTAVDDIYAHYA